MSQHVPESNPGNRSQTVAADEGVTLPPAPSLPQTPTPIPVTIDLPSGPLPPLSVDAAATLPNAGQVGGVNFSSPHYKIVRELGRGGMGLVYLARQVGLNRLVALKMILSGEYARTEEVTRFRNEAEAVAKLKHPNIIQIYDIGEENSRPFFAMELADAGSLADRLTGIPLRAEEAAPMVETLARAMHHAHLNGIVHRDLKPINVLLSTSGSHSYSEIVLPGDEITPSAMPLTTLVPKITDFGLAKRMDSKGRTISGHVVGTVNYMAPEQAEGRSSAVGPCSDIYGLGAILYECLTGRPPFVGENLISTLEQVRTQEPKPVRDLNLACPRDLETICLKCLDKEPERRYGSALELADDLRAFQEDRPIKARPISSWERLCRAIQRRRRETIWGSCAALALLILGGVLWRNSATTRREHEQARQEYVQAIDTLRDTRQLVTSDNRTPEQVERAVKDLPRHYQQIQQKLDDAELRLKAARACDELGETLWKQGLRDEASDAGKVAQRLYGGLLEAEPNNAAHRQAQAVVRLREGKIRADSRNDVAADTEFRGALDDLKLLEQAEPNNLVYQRHLAEVYHQLGELNNTLKKRHKAVEHYTKSLEIREKLAKSPNASRQFRRDLARGHGYLGDVWLELNENKKAWAEYEEAEKIRQKLADEDINDAEARFQLARSHGNEGYYGLWIGDTNRSLAGFEKARVLQEKLLADNPNIAEYAGDLGWSLLNIAELKMDRDGAKANVLPLLEKARKLYEGLSGASNVRNLARAYIGIAQYHLNTNPDKARAALANARPILEKLNAEDQQQRRTEDPEDLYHLALVEAMEGSSLPPSEEKKRWAKADSALRQLDFAIRLGYTRASRLGRKVAAVKLLWETEPKRMEAVVERCRNATRPEQ